jgi:hypothetical protein
MMSGSSARSQPTLASGRSRCLVAALTCTDCRHCRHARLALQLNAGCKRRFVCACVHREADTPDAPAGTPDASGVLCSGLRSCQVRRRSSAARGVPGSHYKPWSCCEARNPPGLGEGGWLRSRRSGRRQSAPPRFGAARRSAATRVVSKVSKTVPSNWRLSSTVPTLDDEHPAARNRQTPQRQ